jgi:hypothetical protein
MSRSFPSALVSSSQQYPETSTKSRYAVSYSLISPNILLRALFPNNLSLCSSFRYVHQCVCLQFHISLLLYCEKYKPIYWCFHNSTFYAIMFTFPEII